MYKSLVAALALAATVVSAAPNVAVVEAPTASMEKRSFNGLATVYEQLGGFGSCGNKNPDSAKIAALSNSFMKNQFKSPYCGRKIKLTNTGSNDGVGGKGRSVVVTVQDTCPSCNQGHVDLSVGAWNALTNNAPWGTVNINWDFV
jgi:hypothetical protein